MRKLTGALIIFVLLLTLPAALLATAQSEPPVFRAVLCEAEAETCGSEFNTGPPAPFGIAEAIELDNPPRIALRLQVMHLEPETLLDVILSEGTKIGDITPNQGGTAQKTFTGTFEIGDGTQIDVGPLRGHFEMVGRPNHPDCQSEIESSLTTIHDCPDIEPGEGD